MSPNALISRWMRSYFEVLGWFKENDPVGYWLQCIREASGAISAIFLGWTIGGLSTDELLQGPAFWFSVTLDRYALFGPAASIYIAAFLGWGVQCRQMVIRKRRQTHKG